MFIISYPCYPICPYIVYNFLYYPKPVTYINDANEANGMRGKKRNKDKYDVGVTEVIQLIECYNPVVSSAILRCGLPFLTARKFVKKLINLSTKDYCEYEGPPFTGYFC